MTFKNVLAGVTTGCTAIARGDMKGRTPRRDNPRAGEEKTTVSATPRQSRELIR